MDPLVASASGRAGVSRSPFRRRHFIELHEQSWFPEVWRDLFRAGLGRAFVMFGLSRELSRALTPFLAQRRPSEVLDLCSGSGDCSVDAWQRATSADRAPSCSLVLSDLYPARRRWAALGPSTRFVERPLDIRALTDELPRTWTMLNSLHHFTPDDLRLFLRTTTESADAFFAVDRSARNWREMLMTVFVVPLASALITAFAIRPFRPRNLLWGLLIPVIPLVALVDGLVSNLRSYTVEELRSMAEDAQGSFTWKVGMTPGGQGVPAMIYIMGWRRDTMHTDGHLP